MKNRNNENHDNWATPPDFKIKRGFFEHLWFDPCPWNHDLNKWDGLKIPWKQQNFVNPPYSPELKKAFILKALAESAKGKRSVFLLPVSTSTILFHDIIKPNKIGEPDFLRGRLPFIGINDKGQHVNYHLVQEIDKHAKIVFEDKELPLYIRNQGQHDSMLITF